MLHGAQCCDVFIGFLSYFEQLYMDIRGTCYAVSLYVSVSKGVVLKCNLLLKSISYCFNVKT